MARAEHLMQKTVLCDKLIVTFTKDSEMSPSRRKKREPTDQLPKHPVRAEDEDAWEDYQDYCMAAEALEEALEEGEVRPFEEFVKELTH
ncbi:MAG: hypothetical protein AB1473_23265 [Thermodesulfobacteriota bacterium]